MDSKVFKNIEMMNELLEKSSKIASNQDKVTSNSKEEMLLKAKKKIQDYFDGILKVFALTGIHIDMKDEDISFVIRKDDAFKPEEIKKGATLSYHFTGVIFINDKSSYNVKHYVIDDRYIGCCWSQSRLYGLEEKTILKIVNNFDKIKKTIEDKILSNIQANIQMNADKVNTEAKKLEVLENFLTDNTDIKKTAD